MWNYLSQGEKGEIKQILELKDGINNMTICDLSCKDSTHFACCGESDGEGVVNYWVLNDEKKWEAKEIYKQKEKLEKIKFNEEHTCIVVVDDWTGQIQDANVYMDLAQGGNFDDELRGICEELEAGKKQLVDTSNVGNMSGMFERCNNL